MHGREVSLDLSGTQGPLFQSWDALQCLAAVLGAHWSEDLLGRL